MEMHFFNIPLTYPKFPNSSEFLKYVSPGAISFRTKISDAACSEPT